MSLLDWNSIENSRHGIAVSKKVQSKTIPLLLSEFVCTLNLEKYEPSKITKFRELGGIAAISVAFFHFNNGSPFNNIFVSNTWLMIT